ncbi:MAG: hypothetical protein K6E22_09740 [Treponema sp.]|nr:hypothetical protein [Treponema sp.]
MKNKYILKVMNNEYVVFVHNGYSEFSYGVSINPIVLSFKEYKLLMDYIAKSNFKDFVMEFENSQSYDFIIPASIAKVIGKSIVTLSPPSCCVYNSKEDEAAINEEKKKFLKKVRDGKYAQ